MPPQRDRPLARLRERVTDTRNLAGNDLLLETVDTIGSVVARLHQATTTIAAAVGQQQGATDAIVGNVQRVSDSAEAIAGSMDKVHQAAGRTNAASIQVRDASATMAAMAAASFSTSSVVTNAASVGANTVY